MGCLIWNCPIVQESPHFLEGAHISVLFIKPKLVSTIKITVNIWVQSGIYNINKALLSNSGRKFHLHCRAFRI